MANASNFYNDSSNDVIGVTSSPSCSLRSASSSSATPGSDVTQILYAVIGPTLLVGGLLGNSLVLLTMTRQRMRGTSTSVYLVAMAILDLLVLGFGLTTTWITEAGYTVDYKEMHAVSCKLGKFFEFAINDAAVWVRMAFTFDRLIAVLVPLYVGQCCGQTKTSRFYVIVACVAAVAKNLNEIWTRGPQQVKTPVCLANGSLIQTVTVRVCGYPTDEFKYFETFVRPWIAFALFSIAPFVAIAVCNTLIIMALVMRRRNMKTMSGTASGGGGNKEQQFVQMAMMCVAASTLFLVCTAPSIVVLIGKPYWNIASGNIAAYNVAKAVCNLTFFVTFSANFFLYCVTGDRFRSTLNSTFRVWCCGEDPRLINQSTVRGGRIIGHPQALDKLHKSTTTVASMISGSSVEGSSNGLNDAPTPIMPQYVTAGSDLEDHLSSPSLRHASDKFSRLAGVGKSTLQVHGVSSAPTERQPSTFSGGNCDAIVSSLENGTQNANNGCAPSNHSNPISSDDAPPNVDAPLTAKG